MLKVKEALIQGFSIDEIYHNTGIDPWFLHEIAEIVNIEQSYTSIKDLKFLKKKMAFQINKLHISQNRFLIYKIQERRKK